MKTFLLPKYLKKLILEIHKIIGMDRFILYGGAVTDLFLNKNTRIHDLDIAIKDIDESKISACREKIRSKGFKIIEPHREYYTCLNKKVVLIYAENDKWFLDVGFLDNLKMIGQFDAETLYCRYPELDYVDNFDALGAIRRKTLKPARELEKENPYLLIGRFLNLCAKYNMRLISNAEHRRILSKLKNLVEKWAPINEFHGPVAYSSCLSSIFRSIIKAKDKENFLKELADSHILMPILPELQKVIRNLNNSNMYQELDGIKTKYDLIVLFNKFLEKKDRKSFKDKIKMLQTRNWDKQDIEATNFFC